MNELSKFYKELLESLDLFIDGNGLIHVQASGMKKPLDVNGVPLYLPTDDNVNTAVELVNGKPTPVKVLFNPMEEDVYKGVNESFTKLKNIIELKLLAVIGQIGISMLSITSDEKADMSDMELIKFVNILNKHKIGKRKQMVDTKTISSWIAIYENILSRLENKYVRFFIKKGGKIDNVKYNRVGTITFPFIDKFNEAIEKKEKSFLDVKLRVADTHVITSLFDYMFGDTEPTGHNQFGSFNKKSPSLHTLLLMYDSVFKRLDPIIDTIINYGVEDDIKESLVLRPLHIKAEALGDYMDNLEGEVRRVPNEAAVITSSKPSLISETKPTKSSGSFWDKVKQTNTQPVQQPVYQQQPVQQPVYQQQPIYQQQPVQQPVYQQQPVQQPPAFQQVNARPQQVQSNPFGRQATHDDPWAPQQPQGRMLPNRNMQRQGWH